MRSDFKDPDLEESIAAYTQVIIEDEKQSFHSEMESFEAHAEKIRKNIRDEILNFHGQFQRGYETVSDWLQSHNKKILQPSKEALATLGDQQKLEELAAQGKELYQILGFSEEDLKQFYTAAYEAALNKEFEKAHDAFFFLTTLAPSVADFWYGLAVSATQLKEYDKALAATLRVLSLNPEKVDGYVNAFYIYHQLNDSDAAHMLHKKATDFAKAHRGETWAKELLSTLEKVSL